MKNPHAVALGKLGGRKGGLARVKKLGPKGLSEWGRKAVAVRWKKEAALKEYGDENAK